VVRLTRLSGTIVVTFGALLLGVGLAAGLTVLFDTGFAVGFEAVLGLGAGMISIY